MYDYSGLGNSDKREGLLYQLMIKDQLTIDTQNQIMEYIESVTNAAHPDKLDDETKRDIGGAIAIATLCEWNSRSSAYALLGAQLGYKKFDSNLCGLIAMSIRTGIPVEFVVRTLVEGYESGIIERIVENS